MGSELIKAEAEKSTYSGNPDAIDLTMRGWAILNQLQLVAHKDSLAKASGLFEQALKLDPNNVDALVGAAAAERYNFIYGGMDEKPGQITKIEELLAHAIRIDPTNARAYTVRGSLYIITKCTKEAADAAQNAVRLNHSYASAYAQLAHDQMTPAETPQAIAYIDQAMKLSPSLSAFHPIATKSRASRHFGFGPRSDIDLLAPVRVFYPGLNAAA